MGNSKCIYFPVWTPSKGAGTLKSSITLITITNIIRYGRHDHLLVSNPDKTEGAVRRKDVHQAFVPVVLNAMSDYA